jgi:hypothetical protein
MASLLFLSNEDNTPPLVTITIQFSQPKNNRVEKGTVIFAGQITVPCLDFMRGDEDDKVKFRGFKRDVMRMKITG